MEDVQTAQVTSQSDSGGSESTELQETPVSSQEPQTSQESESLKVEQSQQSTSSEPPVRKASDFYRDRKVTRELKNEIAQLKELISQMSSKQKQESTGDVQLSPEEEKRLEAQLVDKPVSYIRKELAEMKKAFREEFLKELKEKEFPTYIDSFEKQRELKRKEQEALELIYPISESNPKETLEQRIQADPKKSEMILSILEEYGLNHFASIDPISAAKKALEIYDWKMQSAKKSPMAVKKSGIGSTASGSPIGGSEKTTAQDLVKKKEELMKRVSENSDLMKDQKFLDELDKISLALAKHKEN